MARRKKKATPILEGLDFLTQPKYARKFGFLAKKTTKLWSLTYTMSKGFGSFTRWDDKYKKFFMNVDPWLFKDDKKYGLAEYSSIIKALVYHESGHILFSDFKVIVSNADDLKAKYKIVADIADDLMSSTPTKTQDDLTLAIYEFYYAKFLVDMLNSMEDASIEASISSKDKTSYPHLIYLRNQVYDLETKSIHKIEASDLRDIAKGYEPITKELIELFITEIRHMAVIGYRQYLKYWLLPEFYDDTEIEEMEEVARWCRFAAVDTEERNVGAKTLLDMLKDKILMPFAEYMTSEYLSALDDLKNKLQDEEQQTSQNNAASKSMANSGTPSLGGSGKSGGDLPVPQSLAEDIAEQIKNQMQQKRSKSGSSNSGNDDENNNPSQGGNSGESQDEENQDEGQGQGGKDGYTDYSQDSLAERKIPDYQKTTEELSKEAERAMNEALRASKKTFDKVKDQIDKSKIEGGKVISESAAMHDNIGTQVGTIQQFGDDISYYGDSVQKKIPELNAYVNPLSKNMKKLLMYKSRDRSLIGQNVGKLNTKQLYRAHTDGRIFRKDTEGEKRNVRFCILVDESGSMSGSNIINAIQGCYVVAKAAQRIKVPFAIYGHTEMDDFEMRQYVDYKNCFKKKVLDDIFKMDARGCNRDGLAIYKSLCSLVQAKEHPDELQFLFVISDGQPNGDDYGGYAAINEMQGIMKKFKKLYNIETIGIAIGYGCEEVAAIYKNNVMVENVSQLPDVMLQLLKDIV